MEEARLDNELKRIYKKFPFLWENHDFRVRYFTRDYGMYYQGFIIGLENNICKLVFEKETNSPAESIAMNVGTRHSLFAPPNFSYFAKDGWYPLTGLIYWLSGVECERDKNVDQDLENVSQYLKLHIDKLLDLFKFPDEFNKKLEYYRNLHKENQITVEKIQEERARLQALGQDSSLEAAIASLRGGQEMNNPGIDLVIWERLKKKWAELESAGYNLKIDFHLIADENNDENILAIEVIQNINDDFLTETVQQTAGEAYATLGIAGLSMEQLVEVYKKMMNQLHRELKQRDMDLFVTMSPSSPTSGEVWGYVEKPNSNVKDSVLVNYQHYYVLNALREKMIELVGDSWSKVRAVYRSDGLEFYFEY